MTRFPATAFAAITFAAFVFSASSPAAAQDLATFGVLGGSTVTNTGTSVINGNVGVSPGTAIVGFPPGVVTAPYTIYANNAVAIQAQADLVTAFNVLFNRPATANLSGQDLGGMTLTPGVYRYNSDAQLTGTLTFDGLGDPNAVFIIQVGSALTTASASAVAFQGGATAANVYFVVGSSATLGTSTSFAGRILALTSITLTTTATITCGAALAQNGAVTLDTNTITVCPLVAATFTVSSTATASALALAAVLDAFTAGGSVLPLAFLALGVLTPEELAIALSELSGEIGTGVAPAGMQAMDSFLSLLNSGFDDTPGTPPGPVTVPALGYAPEEAPTQVGSASFASLDRAVGSPRLMSMWAAAYGGQTNTAGNAVVGSHDRFAQAFGFAGGVDYSALANTKIGFAFSAGGTNFGLSESLGSGKSVMLQLGVRSRTTIGEAAYVSAALAYALHSMSTDRYVTVATERFTAAFLAHDVAGEIEAGYRMGWFTPYAAVRGQAFFTPAYSETAAGGAAAFALSYQAQTTLSARTELGVRVGKEVPLPSGSTLALRGRLAWAHDFSSAPTTTAAFQSIPGAPFTVQGAAATPDSLLISAGAELRLTNGISIGGMFDGALAQTAQTYAGSGRIRYTW